MRDFLTQMRSEYQTVVDMKFWEVYQARIAKLLSSASTDTDTIDPISETTRLARSQGKIDAFKIVLGLPAKVVKET